MRRLAALLGLGILAAAGGIAGTSVTDAAYTDSEYATAGFTALTLRPPQIVATPLCVRPPILGGSVFSIQWQWPAVTSAPAGSAVRWKVGTTDGVSVPTTGPDANGRYVSTFDTGLLGGLIGSLLGADIKVEMRTTFSGWTSPTATTMNYFAPLIIGAATCTVVNG